MIDFTAPRFPRAAAVPCFDLEHARTHRDMCRAYGVPLSLGGSALEPEHAPLDLPRAEADAVTIAPRRGAL